jgi:hypothetical protein
MGNLHSLFVNPTALAISKPKGSILPILQASRSGPVLARYSPEVCRQTHSFPSWSESYVEVDSSYLNGDFEQDAVLTTNDGPITSEQAQ